MFRGVLFNALYYYPQKLQAGYYCTIKSRKKSKKSTVCDFYFAPHCTRVRTPARRTIQILYFLLFTFFIVDYCRDRYTFLWTAIQVGGDKWQELGDKVLCMSRKSSTFASDFGNTPFPPPKPCKISAHF